MNKKTRKILDESMTQYYNNSGLYDSLMDIEREVREHTSDFSMFLVWDMISQLTWKDINKIYKEYFN
jgi:hypothetical protein